LWSNAQSGPNISNLAPGTYKVTVTDGATLTATGTTTITQPTAVVLTVTNGIITCANPLYTIISMTNGGVSPYTYSWSNGESTPNISVSIAGTYMLTITDANGCTKVKTSVVIANTTPPTVTLSAPAINCTTPVVQISSTVTGGKVPYTYKWSNNQTTANISVDNAGPFTVTVTDANGCSTEKSITVTLNNTLPVVNIDAPSKISCVSPQVQINASSTPLGNNNWTTTNGHIVSGKTTLHPIVDKAGTYVLTVTIPANGCSASESTEVIGVSPVNATVSFSAINCFGDSSSIATISTSGGLPPYTYSWSNGANSSIVDSLPAGNYSVIVKDNSSCIDTVSFSITQPTKLNAVINSTDQTGPGKSDGTAILTASGGTPPYEVLWSTGDTTYSIDSLSVGSYNVTLTDFMGCSTTQSAFVNPYNCGMSINSTITQAIDCFGQTGSICSDIQGGTPPYTYNWSNGSNSNCLINTPAGIIGLTVTDAVGCKTIKQIGLTQPTEIKLTPDLYTIIPETAFDSKDASIIAMAAGGTAPYLYTFDKGVNGLLPSGDNIITVTDSKACKKNFSIYIAPYNCDSLGVEDVSFSISNLCYLQTVTICATSIIGGVSPYTYNWNDNTSFNCFSSPATGSATVTITDSKNCTSVFISNYNIPTEIVSSTIVKNASAANNDGTIQLTVTGGASPLTYHWSNSSITEDLQNLSAGTYCVTITDANACTKVVCVEVKMEVGTLNLEEAGWKLFPNPAKDLLTLQHSNNLHAKLSWYIFDEYGKIYLKSKENNTKGNINIAIDKLSPGNYFIHVQDAGTKLIGKFVKK
ncbi:MAG TPA: T9SS type A sorting domain-containing protein, partial [Saprospiraceae bacterium]|nr:T9SS type A sorting domain-containing protein [Saprospiraceae bacterium]